ncbi:MAG: glycosyltransferase family 39 protein [Chloroflexota bacterium]|nr:glycosyltransferase family 39 protein [Chloroflexota bacterium]
MPKSRQRRFLSVAAVIGVALVLRVIALSTRGIWYDDAFSILLARQDPSRIVAGTAADTMPPLYYFALHLWMQLGTGVATLRLLNVLVSLAILALTFRLAHSLFDLRTATAAALLTAVSPFQIHHAQELRMYGLLCLNLLLYLYFFSRIYLGPERRVWPFWIGLIAAGALAMVSHNLAAFTLLSANLLLLLQRRWRLLGRLVLAQFAILLLASPWLVMVPGQVAKIQRAFWTPRPGLLELVQALVAFHSDLPVPGWMLSLVVATSVLFLVLVSYELVRRWPGDARVQLLAAFACLPPLLLFGFSYAMRPLFVPRGFILSSVAYYVLAAVVIVGRGPRLLRGLLLVSFVLVGLLALPGRYTFDEFPRSPFRPAVEFLRPQIRPGDVVLHDNKLSYFPMRYYAPDVPQAFLPDEPGSHNDTLAPATQDAMEIWPVDGLREATDDAVRVWFVFFTRAVEEWQERGDSHPTLQALEQQWQAVDHVGLNDLEVILFERR